jgi:pyruvate/oxaloacetate carboxyltransferase
MDPFGVYERIRDLRAILDLEIEMHAHDDLGLATANSLAAVRGGATHLNTTVHGLGERAGNAALEEVVMGLKHLTASTAASICTTSEGSPAWWRVPPGNRSPGTRAWSATAPSPTNPASMSTAC